MQFYQIAEEYLPDSSIYSLPCFQEGNIQHIRDILIKYCEVDQTKWNTTLLKSFSNVIDEILVLIVMNTYDLFEKSSEYRIWREYERKCVNHHIKHEFASSSPVSSATTNNVPPVITPSYFLKKAFTKLSTSVIRKLINISWLKTTLKCLENMPFPFSVVTPDTNKPPTICYLNEEFVRLTGYQKVIKYSLLSLLLLIILCYVMLCYRVN